LPRRWRYALIKTREKTHWYEDDSFWEAFCGELFSSERLAGTPQEVDQLIELLQLQPGAKVLDLCCGVGRHSLELARRGFEVTGLDRTAEFLDQARRGADAEGLHVDFVQADMRRFCALEEFDAVVNLFTSFGYFEDPYDDKRVVLNAYASLKRGGKLLIELIGKEILARKFQARDWLEHDGRIVLQERQVSDGWSWMKNRWILFENGQQKEFTFGHRVYSATELTDLLKRCGFAKVKVFGNLAGAPYNDQAQRLVTVAIK
jgi:SAM-dependent methyltransferase